jgi:TPR repeat protein
MAQKKQDLWKFLKLLLFLALTTAAPVVQVELDPAILERGIAILEKATDNVPEDTIELARGGDIPALYQIARKLEDADVERGLETALHIFHSLADSETGHIASQISLGFAYYKKIKDHNLALKYFIKAGEGGPHQAALFNAGRILAENSNFVPAIAYMQVAARFAESMPEDEARKLTETCTDAYNITSEKVALHGLTIQESADIFQYAALDGFPRLKSKTTTRWAEAMKSLLAFNDNFVSTNGQPRDQESLEIAVSNLREIWEANSSKLSKLQTHLLLEHINEALALLARSDDLFLPAAAGYAEAFAMSEYCNKQVALFEEEPGCFNGAVTTAMSYYRRSNDVIGLQRVLNLARQNPGGSTAWKLVEQTPRVSYSLLI